MVRRRKKDGGNGFWEEAPEVVAMFSLHPPGLIILPGITTSLVFPKTEMNSRYVERLKEDPFLVLVPLYHPDHLNPRGRKCEIGVMGRVVRLRAEKERYHCSFFGYGRVHHQESADEKVEGKSIALVRWQRMNEVPIDPKDAGTEEFVKMLDLLKELFDKFLERVKEQRGEEFAAYLNLPSVKEALERLQELDGENLSLTIDSIMNLLNTADFAMVGVPVNFSDPSFFILKEEKVIARLGGIISLLEFITLANPVMGGDKDLDTPDPASEDKDDGELDKGPDTKSISSAGEVAAPRINLLQEVLRKPREIKPRPPIRKTGDPPTTLILLDWKRPAIFEKQVLDFFSQYLINQEFAIRHIARKLLRLNMGRTDPRSPTFGGIFLGPTSVGKTELVKVLAKFLFDDFNGYTHVSCDQLQQDHQIAHLIGAPPGYIGHDEEPVFSQWRIDKPHFLKRMRERYSLEIMKLEQEIQALEERFLRSGDGNERKTIQAEIRKRDKSLRKFLSVAGYKPEDGYWSVILFDEIERAHPQFFNFCLGILHEGELQLMNGEITNLRRSIICGTSNIYGPELMRDFSGRGRMGFIPDRDKPILQNEFREDPGCRRGRKF